MQKETLTSAAIILIFHTHTQIRCCSGDRWCVWGVLASQRLWKVDICLHLDPSPLTWPTSSSIEEYTHLLTQINPHHHHSQTPNIRFY